LTSIHSNAFQAARSAHCAEDQDRFWEYHDELYRRQETWSPLADPTIAFAEYAATVGMNVDDFRACLSSARHADLVRANDELASALGVSSTPSILVQVEGARIRRSPAYDFETVARTIDQVVASAAR
jgi:protein-disulfide isomerase